MKLSIYLKAGPIDPTDFGYDISRVHLHDTAVNDVYVSQLCDLGSHVECDNVRRIACVYTAALDTHTMYDM